MRDIAFEAAFLRDALLVGLMHERQVPEWAAQLIAANTAHAIALAELLSVPVQLSPIRDALRAFGEVRVPLHVTGALLTSAALEPAHRRLGEAHLLRVLSDIRRLAGCPAHCAETIMEFEARAMLAAAGPEASAPTTSEILRWLDEVRQPGHFLVTCGDRQKAASFVAALSLAVASAAYRRGELTFEGRVDQMWVIGLDEIAGRLRGSVWALGGREHHTLSGAVARDLLVDGACMDRVDADVIEARLAALAPQ